MQQRVDAPTTYYGRAQLKPAPFNPLLVGGYIFLAGVSGAAAMIATAADLLRGPQAAPLVRRGRYAALLAPTVGAGLLVWDLHTPRRFYNMLRIAKGTSPMSLGTWCLMAFSATAGVTAAAQFGADRVTRGRGFLRGLARVAQVPAALAGAGIATYTASLLSATSTPLWAAAPRALAARFAGSSVAAGAAALSLFERSSPRRRDLDAIMLAGLTAELAGAAVASTAYRQRGVSEALDDSGWGHVERYGAAGLGGWLPAGLLLVAALRGRTAPDLAPLATLAGSALLRVSILGAGAVSAARPAIGFRLTAAMPVPDSPPAAPRRAMRASARNLPS